MAKLFLPDNTVLINFALLHRMDLLAELIKGQGAWCVSVARECRASSEYPRLEEAETVAVVSRRQLDGFFMTDDGDAQALAVHQCGPRGPAG